MQHLSNIVRAIRGGRVTANIRPDVAFEQNNNAVVNDDETTHTKTGYHCVTDLTQRFPKPTTTTHTDSTTSASASAVYTENEKKRGNERLTGREIRHPPPELKCDTFMYFVMLNLDQGVESEFLGAEEIPKAVKEFKARFRDALCADVDFCSQFTAKDDRQRNGDKRVTTALLLRSLSADDYDKCLHPAMLGFLEHAYCLSVTVVATPKANDEWWQHDRDGDGDDDHHHRHLVLMRRRGDGRFVCLYEKRMNKYTA